MMDSYAGILVRMLASVVLSVVIVAMCIGGFMGWLQLSTVQSACVVALILWMIVTPSKASMDETCAFLKALKDAD